MQPAHTALGSTTPSVFERLSNVWFALRNRILSSPRFQRWAAEFPLTRFIARSRAKALFDLCAGFVYSQVLAACAELGVLTLLADGPRTAAEVGRAVGLSPAASERLLEAAASLKLVERRPRSTYGLGIHGASYVRNDAVARMVEHHKMLYRDLADPIALLRDPSPSTELRRYWSYARKDGSGEQPDDVAGYSALMASSNPWIAADVLDAYPLGHHRALLDVGGGEGVFAAEVAARYPAMTVSLFDLPAVAARARERFERMQLGPRVTAVGGDVLVDPLPRGADVVTLVRVLHDHNDDAALAILAATYDALPPGGTVLVAEPMSGYRGAEAMADAYFGFYLLAMGQGRPRTPREVAALLARAGFKRPEVRSTRRPILASLVLAKR
jgi:demethylspheroidene O-methyltransferase